MTVDRIAGTGVKNIENRAIFNLFAGFGSHMAKSKKHRKMGETGLIRGIIYDYR